MESFITTLVREGLKKLCVIFHSDRKGGVKTGHISTLFKNFLSTLPLGKISEEKKSKINPLFFKEKWKLPFFSERLPSVVFVFMMGVIRCSVCRSLVLMLRLH